MTDTILQAFMEEVEAYLSATGMSATALGRKVANDSHAIHQMRKGAPTTSRKMSEIKRFMEQNPPAPLPTDDTEAA